MRRPGQSKKAQSNNGAHVDYETFLKRKVQVAKNDGFEIELSEINPILKPHQKASVQWAVRGGKRALFESFGLGKSIMQLEIVRLILAKLGRGRGLIIAPLGVRQEFKRDAVQKLGWEWPPHFVRTGAEVEAYQRQMLLDGKTFHGIYITNYESVRDGKLNPELFDVVSLDEAAILRGIGGVKTFREFMRMFAGDSKQLNSRVRSRGIQYRFVATATPSPNEYIELLAYAAFLGIMDISGAKTRFFRRDSTKADKLTLHKHKEREFWLWCSSWALFLESPADLGFDPVGYDLPELRVIKHEVAVDHSKALSEKDGQQRMFRDSTHGVVEAAKEKRDTLEIRIERMVDIVQRQREASSVLQALLRGAQDGICGAHSESPKQERLLQEVLSEEQSESSGSGATVLPKKQREGRRQSSTVEESEPGESQGNSTQTDRAEPRKGNYPKPRAVPSEQRTSKQDKPEKQTKTLRPNGTRIRSTTISAERTVCNLSIKNEESHRRSLPQDGASPRDSVREVQRGTGRVSGRPGYLDPCGPIPQFIVWCELNDEQKAVEQALDRLGISYSSLYGATPIEEREVLLEQWRNRETVAFVSKPEMYGAGVNLQQCHLAIFLGIGFKFAQFLQAIKRIHRFLQTEPVEIHIIYAESERSVLQTLETKWTLHNEMVNTMSAIIKQYGLSHEAMTQELKRGLGVERVEIKGESYTLVNEDAILETRRMDADSVDLILTSIPFCYDQETEILTRRRGWIGFGMLGPEDEVATISPSKLCLEWQGTTRIVWEHYTGEMFQFGNRCFDLLVTPNHNLFAARRGKTFSPKRLGLVEAEQIAREYESARRKREGSGRILRGWKMCLVPPAEGSGNWPTRIEIPPLPAGILSGHGVELYWIKTEDFMALAGWYLSEGHADSFTTSRSGGRISIAQVVSETKRQEIADLFVRIGLPPSWHSRQLSVWCRNLAHFLIEQFGTGSKRKHIPAWLKDFHPDLLRILRDTMMKGDGGKDQLTYRSYSKELCDDFQEICLKTGWRATVKGTWVHLGTKQIYPEIRQAPKRIKYKGMIGCVTVPNGLVIVRRNGKPCISGNSTQYEYSPNYADFGHSDNNAHFFEQMDFLTPELLRVLTPGRMAAIHVKDRIVPSGMTGLGQQVVYPFHAKCIEHYTHHGFAYMGMKTIVTDVVRENNQTYRLGWSEQCKDGTKMGVGMPEYLLLFRKPPTDTSNSYGDTPVVKFKPKVEGRNGEPHPWSGRNERRPIIQNSGYSRSRWQIDAHGFERSAGDRLLGPDELKGLSHQQIFRLFREYSLEAVYNFEHHVRIGEELERLGKLPVTFMLLQPQSWHPDVWTDITRMLTLNGSQSAKGKEMHLCPMQFDLADRVIAQLSMPGETILDPFAGLMTVPYRAIKLGRKSIGIELSPPYFLDGAAYCAAAEREIAMPSLFTLETTNEGELL